VEFDKVVALMMLTERQLGLSRYESENLRFSYPEFERMVFRDAKSPLELPTVALLTEVLSNQLQPAGAVIDDQGNTAGTIPLDNRFKASVTEMMRSYATLGAIVFQDVDGMEAKDNGARLFHVLSAFNLRPGVTASTRPGASRSDQDQLKFWAPEGASASSVLVNHLNVLEQVHEKKAAILEGFAKFMAKMGELTQVDPSDSAQAEKLTGELIEIQTKFDESLSGLPEQAGLKTLAEMSAVIDQVVNAAQGLEQARPKLDVRKFALAVDQRRTQISAMLRANPVLAVLLGAVAQSESVPPSLASLVSGVSIDTERGVVFSNIESLNRYLLMLHPELKR
jgi:hypothetical protein